MENVLLSTVPVNYSLRFPNGTVGVSSGSRLSLTKLSFTPTFQIFSAFKTTDLINFFPRGYFSRILLEY